MIELTHDLIVEFARHNAGIARARDDQPRRFMHICPTDTCSDEVTCTRCRRRAEADLLVATCVEECEHLLKLLDKPAPDRGPIALVPCGTPSAVRRHRRHGEPPCDACREADRERQRERYWARREGKS